jgi:hypothetical protein
VQHKRKTHDEEPQQPAPPPVVPDGYGDDGGAKQIGVRSTRPYPLDTGLSAQPTAGRRWILRRYAVGVTGPSMADWERTHLEFAREFPPRRSRHARCRHG